jgi:hypothetical protein
VLEIQGRRRLRHRGTPRVHLERGLRPTVKPREPPQPPLALACPAASSTTVPGTCQYPRPRSSCRRSRFCTSSITGWGSQGSCGGPTRVRVTSGSCLTGCEIGLGARTKADFARRNTTGRGFSRRRYSLFVKG